MLRLFFVSGFALALGLWLPACASAQTRADPNTWILWRAGPIPFPNEMRPSVPELSAEGLIALGPKGDDLRIVVPDLKSPASRDEQALQQMVKLISQKAPRAQIVPVSKFSTAYDEKICLLLGTLETNAIARNALKQDATALLAGVGPGGYAIKALQRDQNRTGDCIVALGADAAGAWAAAQIMAFSIHPEQDRLGTLQNWPVKLPAGAFWLPFTARYTLDPNVYEIKPRTGQPPPKPRVPFAVRIWGSPMPTLESYQRVIRSLAATGMNTVVVQSGGWVDLPDAPEVFVKALDIAWQEGLYTILYVGNEERAHLPDPLSRNHRAVVLATKDHPGLLGWHLYNQLAAKLTPEERDLVREQIAWLRSVSDKPIGNEVVWGHNMIEIPADKQQLMRDLASWGNTEIATDYAPIGGWTRTPILSRWEDRLQELAKLGVRGEAVLQAHVPFLKPTVPRREELRNQYWWALAGGARGFYVETAYLFTHFSVRGLLAWNGQPLGDGRYDEVRDLATITRKLEPLIADGRKLDEADAKASGVALVHSRQPVSLRLFEGSGGTVYALLINDSLDEEAAVRLTISADGLAYNATDVLNGKLRGRLDDKRQMAIQIPVAGGAVYELRKAIAVIL